MQKSFAAVEVADFQRQSHATGLDLARFCQLPVLKAIFLVIVMERTRAKGERNVIYSSLQEAKAKVFVCAVGALFDLVVLLVFIVNQATSHGSLFVCVVHAKTGVTPNRLYFLSRI